MRVSWKYGPYWLLASVLQPLAAVLCNLCTFAEPAYSCAFCAKLGAFVSLRSEIHTVRQLPKGVRRV